MIQMPNGKPGDHPLTDIIIHGATVYGVKTDGLIRKISMLCSWDELHEWWNREIGWGGTESTALAKAQSRYDLLIERSRANGWEIPKGAE